MIDRTHLLWLAAVPKDAEAEAELRRCESAASAWQVGFDPSVDDFMCKSLVELLMSERAAAKAEGYAQARSECAHDALDANAYEDQLTAARAEIERLRDDVSCELFMYGQACDRLTETETKLNNLRDVVGGAVGAALAEAILAIEASR
jgi:hypothetical protein